MARDTAILRVTGFVQGVGFRYTTKHVAYKYDISGTVKNLDDGSVEIHAIAEEENLINSLMLSKKAHRLGVVSNTFIFTKVRL